MYMLSNIVSPPDYDYKTKLNSYSKKSLFYSVFISYDKFSKTENERTRRRNIDIGKSVGVIEEKENMEEVTQFGRL